MRVTHSMMVNNMSYWMSQQKQKLNDAETIVGSGKIINKPSDDPVSIGQILSDHVNISRYSQYESNITQGSTWINVSSATLESSSSTLQNAINTVSEYSAGGTDKTTTISLLTNYYDEVLALANSSYDSKYMYSGNLSNIKPFADEVSIDAGLPADIQFELTGDADDVTIQISDSDGMVVRTITGVVGTPGTNTIPWDGLDDSSNPLSDGKYSFTITALDGTETVAVYPTYRGDSGGKEVMTGENEKIILNNNGESIFSSLLSNLSQAITDITNDSDDLSSILDTLQLNMNNLEAQSVQLSNAALQVNNSNTRLQTLITDAQNRISDLETGSTEEAALKLKIQETAYEEVISATANILKMPKLTDYL